jgi:N-acetylmuramoyl-L-alanine amidase
MMESLALTHASLAYEDTSPGPQLRSFDNLSLPKSAVGILALGITLSIVGAAENAMAYLSYGDTGPSVVALQNQLKNAGYFPSYVSSTGYYGEITYKAVADYQYDMGLAVDGVAGSQTFAALGGGGTYATYTTTTYTTTTYTTTYTNVPMGSHMVVAGAGLNVRSGGDSSFEVIAGLSYGESVNVEYIDDSGWAKLAGGGWVASGYLAAL